MRLNRTLAAGLLTLLIPVVSWATTWDVAQSGCSNTTCAPCCDIQAAVEKASGGDTISVGPGTYPENIDFRNMLSVGDITLEAASGPGTVLVAPATGHTLRHGSTYHNLVTIDGIDFSSGTGSACVYLDHQGAAVLRDINASNCGYTAFLLDNTGNITMRRCTANSNDRHGIQIDGASGAYLEDCTTNSNTMDGMLIINVDAMVEMVNPTADGNTNHGLDFDLPGALLINGATVTNNGGRGIWAWSAGVVYIQNSDIQGNGEVGIDLEWNGVEPVDLVNLTNDTVSGNGLVADDPGVRLREIAGPVTVSDCTFDNNGYDGLSVEVSVVGDLEITGGHANGNADDGFDLRNVGDLTITGASAVGNTTKGFGIDNQAIIRIENAVATDNASDGGFIIDWQDPETIDGVTITGCTSSTNGLAVGGNGMLVRHVAGPVTVTGSQFNGNAGEGLTVADVAGAVVVRDVTSTFNGGSGIETRLDGGPLTIADCISSNNNVAGVDVYSPGILIAEARIHRNIIADNVAEGVGLVDLGGAGPFEATCNDITGNDTGMYLDSPLTVDARWVWWGDPTGPSGQGPGTGDGIYAEPGGTIQHSPWLAESFTAPVSGCPFFTADHESGTLAEWDVVVD